MMNDKEKTRVILNFCADCERKERELWEKMKVDKKDRAEQLKAELLLAKLRKSLLEELKGLVERETLYKSVPEDVLGQAFNLVSGADQAYFLIAKQYANMLIVASLAYEAGEEKGSMKD